MSRGAGDGPDPPSGPPADDQPTEAGDLTAILSELVELPLPVGDVPPVKEPEEA